ncbi:MAG: VacJ family lipoprotein, partial [Desulfovibrio sp.]|nr:VacJ family lipoprotein [Desulfovibrio sp.]
RTGISNVFRNLLFPMRFINNLLQFRFKEAGVEFGRFIVNSTAGLGGLVDVAKHKKTIVPVHPEGEDFGQTLGRWGFGHGFYIVWPFFGPSSVRETFGRAGDYFMYPAFWASYVIHPWYVPSGIQTGFFFNDLDDVLPTYFDLKKAAVDPYIMMREAWVKHRAVQVAR